MLVKSKVSEVQVFRRGATVIRCGEAELTAGKNVLFISGMTTTSMQDSFRLKFPEKIRAVNIQIVDADTMKDDSGKKIEKESERLEKKLGEVAYRIETCQMMLDLWKKNSDFSERTNVSVAEQSKMMEELPGQLLSLHRQLDELNDQQAKLLEEQEKAVEEERKPLIMAELAAEEGGKVPFILQYQENSCYWNPKYEVQYRSDKEPLEVSMKAQILQSSGEDWKQVKVTLYTGNPSISKELPVMSALELSLLEPPKERPRMKGMMAARAVMDEDGCCDLDEEPVEMAAMGMMAGAPMANLMMETASVSEEETMTAFQLPALRDVLSEANGNIADLQFFQVKANYHVLAIPSVDPKCYLTAEIATADWPLPPATAAVYLKDTYVGEVYVDPEEDTDLLTLSLGQDERLTMTRTEDPKKTQDAFLKNSRKQLSRISIQLVNHSSEAVSVLIRDQIPVSTDKAIVVEHTQLSDGLLDEKTGEITWEIKAEPDKTETFELEYSISWPKDKRLNERRRVMKRNTRFCPSCGHIVTGRFCPECGTVVN